MSHLRSTVEARLKVLVGLPLSIARDAADMKGFHFGQIRPYQSPRGKVGTSGEYTLHVQCPWRIVQGNSIVTGSSDRFLTPREGVDYNEDDPRAGNLQLVRLEALLKGFDEATFSLVNVADRLIVQAVLSDNFGGVDIALSGGYKLQIFPAGSEGEDWRFLDPKSGDLVIEAGRLSV